MKKCIKCKSKTLQVYQGDNKVRVNYMNEEIKKGKKIDVWCLENGSNKGVVYFCMDCKHVFEEPK